MEMHRPQNSNHIRHDKVQRQLLVELSAILRGEVKDPRLEGIVLTKVHLREDLKVADIMVCKNMVGEMLEPTKAEAEDMIKGLMAAKGFVHRQLKAKMTMRRLPALHFHYDKSLSEASKVWGLMSHWEKRA